MSIENEIRLLREQVASLTQRVYRLEQASRPEQQTPAAVPVEIEAAPATPPPLTEQPTAAHVPHTDAVAPASVPPPVFTSWHVTSQTAASPRPRPQQESLERRIGSQWLNRIGIVAVLTGVSYFLKLAFDNNWIGPGVRVLIGLVAGIALMLWSERFRSRGIEGFSYSLKAVGIGVLYLSLWASAQAYQLVPVEVAFAGMIAVTAATAWLALRQEAELLASLALLGGFLTPILLSTGQNREVALFSYVALLDLGALAVQRFRPWTRVLGGAWLGTVGLYFAWFNTYYTPDAYGTTVFFISLFFVIFASAPLIGAVRSSVQDDSLRSLLAILNGAVYFLQARAMMTGTDVDQRSSAYAIGLAGLYFGLGIALRRREHDLKEDITPSLVHQGLAVAFLTLAIALRFSGKWIAIGWMMEGAALFYAGARTLRPGVKLFGAIVLGLGLFHLVFIDTLDHHWATQMVLFNDRFLTYLLAMGLLGAVLWLQWKQPDAAAYKAVAGFGVVLMSVLALIALNLEIGDYFSREFARLRPMPRAFPDDHSADLRALGIIRDFTYSAVWMGYGVGLIALGFWRRSAFVRWQAIVLIGFTVLKVFIYDVSALDRVYRILSFIILGGMLLAISYAYQKDWLGLQRGTSAE